MKSAQEIKEYRELEPEELKVKLGDLEEELMRLRFRHSAGSLESPAMVGKVRKQIARAKTVLKQKESVE